MVKLLVLVANGSCQGTRPENTNRRGRLSTVDLLVKVALIKRKNNGKVIGVTGKWL
jgi:hypothetical protein